MAALSTPCPTTPPEDLAALQRRARALAGCTLGELAAWAGLPAPTHLGRQKGYVGQLLERCLGAGASNRAEPDFAHLGVELKTLPVDSRGDPMQSTYVTKVPLCDLGALEWRRSPVYAKLRRVLWVPVQAERWIPLARRAVGQAFLWEPSAEEEQLLQADWEYHLGRVRAGEVNAIQGGDGAVLQVRPKARDGRTTTVATLPDSGRQLTRPCGFYLRPAFTRYLIERYFYGA